MSYRSLDLIVVEHPLHTELISHSVALARGWKFICSDIDVETFLKRDCEVNTDNRVIHACPNELGVNFYSEP